MHIRDVRAAAPIGNGAKEHLYSFRSNLIKLKPPLISDKTEIKGGFVIFYTSCSFFYECNLLPGNPTTDGVR